MNCPVCKSKTRVAFTKQVLTKYNVFYYKCPDCGLIFTQKPYWTEEAYKSVIIDADTGILTRNIIFSRITALIALITGNRKTRILDFAGGYGLMTRLLRDIGLDCYWTDPYSQNIFAKGYTAGNGRYGIVTAFEFLEHIQNPVKTIQEIISKYQAKILIFSTTLHNGNPPLDWWYFVPEGGQHVVFYTKKSLQILARENGLKLSTNNINLHIMSRYPIPSLIMLVITYLWPVYSCLFPVFYKSRTFSDHKNQIL
jgi:hypothetical protein